MRSGTPISAQAPSTSTTSNITFCPLTARMCARPDRWKSSRTSSERSSSCAEHHPAQQRRLGRSQPAGEARLRAAPNRVEPARDSAASRAGRRHAVRRNRCVRVAAALIRVERAERLDAAAHENDVADLGPRFGHGGEPQHGLLPHSQAVEQPGASDGRADGPLADRLEHDRARLERPSDGTAQDAGVEGSQARVAEQRPRDQAGEGEHAEPRPAGEDDEGGCRDQQDGLPCRRRQQPGDQRSKDEVPRMVANESECALHVRPAPARAATCQTRTRSRNAARRFSPMPGI